MSEILLSFAEPIASRAGDVYAVRAYGRATAAGTWEMASRALSAIPSSQTIEGGFGTPHAPA